MFSNPLTRFVIKSLKPFKFWIIGQFIVATIWAIDLSLRPYLLKIMLDRLPTLTPETAISQLTGPASFYLGMSLLMTLTWRFYEFNWLHLNPPLKRHIGDTLMQYMMRHSQSLFQNHFAGSLGNKIKDVMSGIPDLVKSFVDQFFSNLLAIPIALFTVSTVNYKFALILCSWVIIFVIGSFFFSKRARELSAYSAEVRSTVVGEIVDILSNSMNVRLFAGAEFESKKLRITLNKYVKADQNRDWYFLKMFSFQGFAFIVYQSICFVWLIKGFKAGEITPGDFALILTVNIAIIDILWSLAKDMGNFADLLGNISQGLQIALSPLEIQDKPRAQALVIKKGEIAFDIVQFHYKGVSPLFQDKSVRIAPGQKVGLVGYSGSGKSTFVNLILRLYDVTSGRILIDNQDIREVTQKSLHTKIGMIPQDPSLFHRSLMENIRYGRIEATDEEVIKAAQKANAHEFIMKLPQGYESLVGERGVKLSGGQRQRIAIARAILKDAPILILDEATSQLDSVTENEIQESLGELMQGKTTIVIAHRLSTLLHMDRILVFDKGKIVEDGTHESLLAKDGLYKTLWSAQVGGFLGDGRNMEE